MMYCKSLAVLFLMLSTAYSQDPGGLLFSYLNDGPYQSSRFPASSGDPAYEQSEGQNFGSPDTVFSNSASQPNELQNNYGQYGGFGSGLDNYGLQNQGAQPGILDQTTGGSRNGFDNYGLQNQGAQPGILDQTTGGSGFEQGGANTPGEGIIDSLPGISIPQDGASPAWQPDYSPVNSPGFAALPLSFENFGGQGNSFFENQPQEPSPIAQPPLSSSAFDLPDIPLPVGGVPGDDSGSILDSPPSLFPEGPLDISPPSFVDNGDSFGSVFGNWLGTSGTSSGSSSSSSASSSSSSASSSSASSSSSSASSSSSSSSSGQFSGTKYSDTDYDYGGGYGGDYYYYEDEYDDDNWDDDDEDDDDDDLSSFLPLPLQPHYPPHKDCVPWPLANQGNFFPRCCRNSKKPGYLSFRSRCYCCCCRYSS